MSPRVINLYKEKAPKGSIYIGRPSLFGNPFTIDRPNGLDRATVIEMYERYLVQHPDVVEMAKLQLKRHDLLCFCAPQACHGDILLRIANEE